MFRFLHSAKVAPTSPPPQDRLELYIYTDKDSIWKDFAINVEATENTIDYTNPGKLAYELGEVCEREGTIELDAQKIMYFSEVTNYLLLLKKETDTIGFLLLSCYPGPSESKIFLVCVSKEYKGRKYSKIMIDKAKELTREAGKTTLHLEALTRTVGEKVYKPLGFTFNSMRRNNMTATLTVPTGGKRITRKKRKATHRKA